MPTLTERVLDLAARPCGTNAGEVRQTCSVSKNSASGVLSSMEKRGHLIRIDGQRVGEQFLMNQFFARRAHAEAWAARPPMQRANQRIRQSSVSSTSGGGKTRRHGHPEKAAPAVVFNKPAIAAVDPRYHVPATHRGEFSALGPGRYAAEATTCAARALV